MNTIKFLIVYFPPSYVPQTTESTKEHVAVDLAAEMHDSNGTT